jgi:hypothetical protein
MPKALESFDRTGGGKERARPSRVAQAPLRGREPVLAPAAPRAQLSRPPCVTIGQLLRVALLLLAAAVYADRSPSTAASRAGSDHLQQAGGGYIDATPTASIGLRRQAGQTSGR